MGDRVRHIVRIAFACAVTMCVLMSPATAHAEMSSARVRFFQQYRVDVSGLPNTFSYRITREDDAAPVVVDESGSAQETFSLRRDDTIWLTFAFEEGSLTETGTLIYRYKAEPVTKKLEDGLYYVDTLSNDLRAGVNVYYIEIYVTVAADGHIQEVIPTVHVESWDGPKVSDPGWRIDWNEDVHYDTSGSDTDHNQQLFANGRSLALNGGTHPFLLGGPNGNGTSSTSGNTDSSGSASGSNGGNVSGGTGATSGTGSNSAGSGTNSGANGTSGMNGTNGTSSTSSTSGTASTTGSSTSATTTTNGAASSGTSGATSGTNVAGAHGTADGLATTADPTPGTLASALVAIASLLLAMGLIRRSIGDASVNKSVTR